MLISQKHIQILQKCMPYLDTSRQKTIDIIFKLNDLSNSLEENANTDFSSCSLDGNTLSIDDICKNIRPLCDKREQEYIDLFFNIKKVLKILSIKDNINLFNQNNNLENGDYYMNNSFDPSEYEYLSTEKKEFLMHIIQEAEQIPKDASIEYIANIIKSLSSTSLSFTKKEQNLIVETLLKHLPNNNSEQINLLLTLLHR